jgi:hypothetical protein
VVEFDLPGIDANSIDLDVERNVLTVRADRPAREGIEELVAAERSRGVFSRQLILGDNLDTEASIGIAVGRTSVPNTCWVSRSRSRNGSVRINICSTSQVQFCRGCASHDLSWLIHVLYSTRLS